MKFKTITTKEGLSNNSVNDLVSDKYGQLWIATWDGLNLYNGTTIKVFKHDVEDTTSLSGNVITQLLKDRKERIWINTDNKSVSLYLGDGKFRQFTFEKSPLSLVLTKKGALEPFFAMMEGAQVDSYGHFNDVGGIISEGIDFDKAVTKAIMFADTHPGTLVIVTADHETSGFSILQGNLKNHEIEGDFPTSDHTATMVPVFAYGPQSHEFSGVYENNEIYHKILKVLQDQ